MKHIGNLKYAEGSKHKKKRIGRGPGSGHGGTSTRGHKGAQARSGYTQKVGFEGGQMPLHRRLPKFGFFNPFRVEYQVINVGKLSQLVADNKFADNTIDFDSLYELGVISKRSLPLKILGNGDINVAIKITAHSFSETAKQKIESVGGTVIIHE